jgi:KDO2-lipid IV(A) lauroyltransferase
MVPSMKILIIKSLLYGFSLLSLPFLHNIATSLGQLLAVISRFNLTRITRINIALCFPQLSVLEQSALVRRSLIETCKTFTELGALWLWSPERVLNLIQQVTGEEHLQQALRHNKGVILLTPHLGAWELAGLYASAHYPLTALYRPPKLSDLNDFILTARQRAGGCYVPTTRRGIRSLYQALQHHEVVGILPDQVPTESGVFVPFFGIATYTMTLVSRLAQKMGSPVVFVYAERLAF